MFSIYYQSINTLIVNNKLNSIFISLIIKILKSKHVNKKLYNYSKMNIYCEIDTRIDGITKLVPIDSSESVIIIKPNKDIIRIKNSTENCFTHYNSYLQEYNFENSEIINFTLNKSKINNLSYKKIIGKMYTHIDNLKNLIKNSILELNHKKCDNCISIYGTGIYVKMVDNKYYVLEILNLCNIFNIQLELEIKLSNQDTIKFIVNS